MKFIKQSTLCISLIIWCLTSMLTSAQVANSPWPVFGQNIHNTRISPHEGTEQGNYKWSYPFNGVVSESPIIGPEGNIYIGHRNALYAIRPNGTLKWKHVLKGEYGAISPAISKDSVLYFGSQSGKLALVNLEGERYWSVETGEYNISAPPLIGPDGTIYFNSIKPGTKTTPPGGRLYAMTAIGTEEWKIDTPHPIPGSPAFGTDTSIIFASKATLYKANTEGEIRWTYTPPSSMNSTPTVGPKNRIYVGTRAGTLRVISADGKLQWKYNAGGHLKEEFEDGVYDGSGAVNGATAIGMDSTIFITNENKKATSDSGFVHALTPVGKLKWKREIETLSGYQSPAMDSSGTVYVGANTGIYSFDSDGNVVWHNTDPNAPGESSSPAIGPQGTIYIAGPDSSLHAIGGPPVSIPEAKNQMSSSYQLKPNYPNPFNPTTSIRFSLPKPANVLLTVYNTIGQQVATLIQRNMNAGTHTIRFDGTGLTSGVYFYKLKTPLYRQSRKMLLVK